MPVDTVYAAEDLAERERLLGAGLELLATVGVQGATPEAVEDTAEVQRGTIGRHFADVDEYIEALADHYLRREEPRVAETPSMMVSRWLDQDRAAVRARFELMALSLRNPRLRAVITRGREAYVRGIVQGGVSPERARLIVAAFDGVLLDALVRDDQGPDLAPLFDLFTAES